MSALIAPSTTDAAERRPVRWRGWISWIAIVVALVVFRVGGAANTPEVRAATDRGWVVTELVLVLIDALALFVALRLARRYPIGPSQPLRHVGPHGLAAIVYAAAQLGFERWIAPAFDPVIAPPEPLLREFAVYVFDFGMWTAVAHGFEYVRRFRQSEAATLRLRTELADAARRRAEAELRAFKAELNPIVVSNALGGVLPLIRADPAAAERSIAEIGDMMRAALSRAGADEMPRDESAAPDEPSTEAPLQKRSRVRPLPLLLIACFAALFVLGGAETFGTLLPNGAQRPLYGALFEAVLAAAYLTAMLYVAIRLERGRPESIWRAHAITAGIFGLVNGVNRMLVPAVLGAPYVKNPPGRVIGAAIVGAFVYAILATIARAVVYARRYRGSEAAALRLRAEVADAGRRRAEAQLRALKMELNPHFLGNALNTLVSLVRTDPASAERVLRQLDDTLRETVSRVSTQEVTLEEEIQGLAPFLDVERARFGDRLAVSWEIDEAALQIHVPHLILQPLIENAVKHGFASRGEGRIVVAGRRAGERLELSVKDNGAGPHNSQRSRREPRGGVGLANTRARLRELYGSEASFDLVAAPDAGTIARLTLPWR